MAAGDSSCLLNVGEKETKHILYVLTPNLQPVPKSFYVIKDTSFESPNEKAVLTQRFATVSELSSEGLKCILVIK